MAEIVFYENPGCINGEKQKSLLMQAGNQIICRNILTTQWTPQKLGAFLGGRGAEEIMNYTAPDIKNGKIDPLLLSYEEAVTVMIENPILIKRPLIEVDGLRIQGFTGDELKSYLGSWDRSEDVVSCPNLLKASCDEEKE